MFKRFFIFILMLFAFQTMEAQTTDTKDVQIARKKLRVGLDTAKYVTSTTHTVTAGSTHRQMPTAKAVWDAIVAGGGGGGGGGHIILDDDTVMDQRSGLNFISTPTITVTASDDLANDETEIRLIVPNNGITSSHIADGAVGTTEITDGSVALADMANMATSSLIYRKTAGTGAPEVNTMATLKTDLGLTGTNSGDQTITLTGDVTGSGTGSFSATIADNSVDGTDIALGSDAQGDIMYYDGTNYVRLGAGTSGQFLQTAGPSANPIWANGAGGSDNWGSQVVATDATLTGTGVTGSLLGLADNAVTNAKVADNAIGSTEITDGAVALADMANMATSSLIYRKTAGSGAPEVNTLATLKTDLGLTGTNSGDQTITLTGDVTGSGTGSFVATIASNAVGSAEITDATVALADMANMATSSLIYRKTAGTGAPEVNTLATLKTDLGLTGTNSGDQTITLTGDVTGSGTGSFSATIADNSVDGTDIALGSDAQGDIMYYDGTNYVRLGAGTSGQFLQTSGPSANPIWANGAGGSDNWGSQVVATDATLTGTGITGSLLGLADNAVTNAKVADNAIGSTEITDGAVALADMANMATSSLIYRKTAGSGAPEVNTLATLKTDLGLTGTNSGDQTITLTGDVTGSGTGSFVATIASNAVGSAEITDGTVALADMANMATSSLIYRKTAGTGAPEVNTLATLKTDLGLTGTNSGDQTITLTGDVTGSGTGSFAATIADNSVDGTDIALGTDAQGDVMYYNGTDWVRLGAGTAGQFLQTSGPTANPVWANSAGSSIYTASGTAFPNVSVSVGLGNSVNFSMAGQTGTTFNVGDIANAVVGDGLKVEDAGVKMGDVFGANNYYIMSGNALGGNYIRTPASNLIQGATNTTWDILTGNFKFTDSRVTKKGMEYSADYSAGILPNDRSIPDIGTIKQIYTAGTGITLTPSGSNVVIAATGGGGSLSGLTAATAGNTIDNLNFAQAWNWSTASTQTLLSSTANGLTTGTMLNLSTNNNALNSANGLLNVEATGTATSGLLARFKANTTAGAGMYIKAIGNIGIGTDAPGSPLSVSNGNTIATAPANAMIHATGTSSTPAIVLVDAFSGGVSGSGFSGRHARGTSTTPTALSSGDILTELSGYGYHSGSAFSNVTANIRFRANQAYTATNQGSNIGFFTTPDNSTTVTERMTIRADGGVSVVGLANAKALYCDANGTLTDSKITLTVPATGATLTLANNSTLATSGAFSTTFTATNNTTVTLPTTGTLSTLAGTETLTNKAITKRVTTIASSATPSPSAATDDAYTVTALAAGATFGSPGAGTEAQGLIIRIKDNGTSRTLAWNGIYRFSADIPAPAATIASATLYLGFIYNSTDSKWDCVSKINF